MKEIMDNFVTSRYKPFSQRPFSKKSFVYVMNFYLIILGIFVMSIRFADVDESSNVFWNLFLIPLLVMIFLNIIGYFIFRKDTLKKYAVIIAYFSGVASLFFIVAYMIGFREKPSSIFFDALRIIIGFWIIGIVLHIILVWISLKKGSMKIRDKYGDYYGNILGGISIVFIMLGEALNNDPLPYVGMYLIVSALLIVLTFNFPRIIPYWTGDFKKMADEVSEIHFDEAYIGIENFELIFDNITVNDIDKILNELKFKAEKVERSHFFMDGKDKEYKDIVSFSQYFKEIGTCSLLVKDLDLGITIKKAVITISFDEVYGVLSVYFTDNDWENKDSTHEENANILYNKLVKMKDSIHYTSILFGYEPADQEDMELFRIDNLNS